MQDDILLGDINISYDPASGSEFNRSYHCRVSARDLADRMQFMTFLVRDGGRVNIA
jgi:hypothetical protein